MAALGLACKMKAAGEAVNGEGLGCVCGGVLFVFNKLSLKEREDHKDPEKRDTDHLCVFPPLLHVLEIIKMRRIVSQDFLN